LQVAKEKAAEITTQALQQARAEAKGIVESAKSEGLLIAKRLRTDAEKESRELILAASDMKQKASCELTDTARKAEETAQNIIASAKEKAEKAAQEIIEQARSRALKEREYTIASAVAEAKRAAENESTQIQIKARQEAENIFNSAKERVRVQLEESSRLMIEIQQKMNQIINNTGIELNKPAVTAEFSSNSISHQIPVVHPVAKEAVLPHVSESSESLKEHGSVPEETQTKINSLFFDEENRTYEGRLKIDIAPPVDIDQINNLEQYLAKAPNLKVIQKGVSEDGSAWIEIDINNPVPLLDILKKVPGVKDVVGCKSYIIIALKSRQTV
jgi:vacuolar-type H+-ATPase subunit H